MTEDDCFATAVALRAAQIIAEALTVPVAYDAHAPRLESIRNAKDWEKLGQLRQATSGPVQFPALDFRMMTPDEFAEKYLREEAVKLAAGISADGIPAVTLDLPLPECCQAKGRAVSRCVAARFVSAYDIVQDQLLCRIDVLFAHRTAEPATLAA
jgi:hypothetical protein